jgi:hypothetical protein
MDVVVDIAAALICFASTCHPALVGVDTPKGEFELKQYSTTLKGYGGDLLVFKQEGRSVFAIHRVFDVPGQQRIARLRSPHANHRVSITGGCVNIDPKVYDELVDCCSNSKVTIR